MKSYKRVEVTRTELDDTVVLLAIVREKPASLSRLMRDVSEEVGRAASLRTLRSITGRLEREGLIRTCGFEYAMLMRFPVYTVTTSGRAHLAARYRELTDLADQVRAALLSS